jgi:hypothetical protein
MNYFLKLIKVWANRRSYRAAVKQAQALRSQNFKKHFVIFWNGEFNAVSKQRLKDLHKNGSFKRGVSFRQLERMVVYTTK